MSKRVKTLQVGKKLFILDGVSPLRYVDLEKNTVKQYKPKKTRVWYKVTNAVKKVINS